MSDDKSTALELVLTPEMNQAIAMAERKPRAIAKFIRECIELATMDEDTVSDCLYALPRKERNQITGETENKMIEGPSARLAEIINYQWGNCRAEGKITDDRGDFVIAEGTFIDLEKNSGVRTQVRRRITTRSGQRFNADMIATTGNAAISIARRNAILAGIPKVFWVKIYDQARKMVAGDSQTLVNRRSEALAYMMKIGVTSEMVLSALNLKSTDEINLDHLVSLRGMATAIKEGEHTVEELFLKNDDASGNAAITNQSKPGDKKDSKAPVAGSTMNKARDALKGSTSPSSTALAGLRASADKAGISEAAIAEKYSVESLDVMTKDQIEEASRYVMSLLAGPG